MSASTDRLVVHTLATPGLGDRSYVAVLDGFAIAVDIQRDLDRVEEILDREKATLGVVLETHIHNDYLTGGLALARRRGAEYVVPAGPRLGYSATRAEDGTTLTLGAMTLRTIDSPGHTDAHAAYSLHVGRGPAEVAFTGGSLLLGATGRSDLLGADRAEALARQQYWSVRRMARMLGGDARILPTHGFSSFCVAGTTVPSGDTVAEQLAVNPAYLLSEDEFVEDLLGKLGAYPSYYSFMGPRNAGGVAEAGLPEVPRLDLAETVGRTVSGATIVDVRDREAWADAHLPGSLSVDSRGALATWLGWITPIDTEIILVAASDDEADAAIRELHRIGFDSITGVHVTDGLRGIAEGISSTPMATFESLAQAMTAADEPLVVDARELAEWRSGHVRGAVHASAHEIVPTFQDALPVATPWVYCGAGFRAAVAASQLERLGSAAIVVQDDVARAAQAAVPWCDGTDCTDLACTASLALRAAA
jgi:hydroxyacylglutathione hydrolase